MRFARDSKQRDEATAVNTLVAKTWDIDSSECDGIASHYEECKHGDGHLLPAIELPR